LDHIEIDPLIPLVEDDLAILELALKGAVDLYLCRFPSGQRTSPLPSTFGAARSAVVFDRR
jgi:hypothetical protein